MTATITDNLLFEQVIHTPPCDGFILSVPCPHQPVAAAVHEGTCCRASFLCCELHRQQYLEVLTGNPGVNWIYMHCKTLVGKLLRVIPL